jgi:hypothetical protein
LCVCTPHFLSAFISWWVTMHRFQPCFFCKGHPSMKWGPHQQSGQFLQGLCGYVNTKHHWPGAGGSHL